MKRTDLTIFTTALACLTLMGCGAQAPSTINDVLNESSSGQSGTIIPPGNQTGNEAVGGVINENSAPGPQPSQQLPANAILSARVRNESAASADVTIRFILNEMIVHLSFVRVLPETVTTVASPQLADLVELSGINELGQALESKTLVFGLDFDETTPAEYVINGTGDSPVDPTPDQPIPGEPGPTTLTLLEPESDITLAVGSTFTVRWTDGAGTPGAVVRVFLRPAQAAGPDDWIPLGPAVGAALDGINDQLVVVLQDLEPGSYEVVGQINDGTNVAASLAPGLVGVVMHPDNAAPTLSISSPSEMVELRNGDMLTIEWDDADPDDNATITFALAGADSTGGIGVGTFQISPPLAEDPDGDAADRATLKIDGLLPGRYALVGTIDDGELVGTARVEDVVQILPEAKNHPPQLELIEPAWDVDVEPGGSFFVQWLDSDANDNARISLLLDPDVEGIVLSGNEILLVASLGEDEDGAGDAITLGLPAGIDEGTYRLVGVITDGLVEVVTYAPGLLSVAPDASNGGGNNNYVPPPPPREAVMSKPSDDEKTQLGDVVTVRLDTISIPATADVGIYLTNEPFGGQVRADVTPGDFVFDTDYGLVLPSSTDVIPNDAWPRRFVLEAEVLVEDETLTAAAPGRVWIRQELELLDVEMVNYWCTSPDQATFDDTSFCGLRITWRGGGYGDGEEILDPIHFWLSMDQTVPADDEDDAWHRMMYDGDHENPGPTTNLTSIDIEQAIGVDIIWEPGAQYGELGIPIEQGEYSVMAVVATDPAAPEPAVTCPTPIEVCFPLPNP